MATLETVSNAHPPRRGNLSVALICASIVVGMIGLSYAAVPLYKLFCQVTGFGGTTKVSAGNINGIIERTMSVRFDSNISSDLQWTVKPATTLTDKIGVVQTVNYV
ncbi:MAG: cytochrome c oxidase assembly protein, partial [Devosiaceae bacterium]|nr:cytochrome c oxidase assembly protein [Devosiaceae bacterium]